MAHIYAHETRIAADIFAAFYRCNTIRKLNKIMKRYGFECPVYGYEAEPSYLSFSKTAHSVGVLHQGFAPRFMLPVIFAFGKIDEPVA
jgi:hypothetical protein